MYVKASTKVSVKYRRAPFSILYFRATSGGKDWFSLTFSARENGPC